ncbi:MAG: TolC family protein [Gammaproteobacteria bacterium]
MSRKLAMCIGFALAMASTSWAVHSAGPAVSDLGPTGKNTSAYRVPLASTEDRAEPVPEPTGDLTLREALTLALKGNAELAAFVKEIRAREGAVRQAGLLPNPVLGLSSANLGNSVLQDFDGPQTNLSLSQLVLLGGKRARAIQAAELDRTLGAWDYEVKRLDVLTQTAQAFVEVLRAQQALTLVTDLAALAERVVAVVSARVRAGKVSPVEETRARVTLASVQIERARATRELEAERARLAASWGSKTPRFKAARGELEPVSPIPSLQALEQRLEQNPDLARWATELAQRQASIDLEQSRAFPDLTVSLGVTEYHDTDDSAVTAGISVPIPIFNRNQGSIQTAEQRLTKAIDERRAVAVEVHAALSAAYQRLAAAHIEVATLKQQVLPGAQSAFDAANQGYRLGKFGFLDVLDAQRTLFASKAQYLRALSDYHKAVVEVERLIGERLGTAVGKQEESR